MINHTSGRKAALGSEHLLDAATSAHGEKPSQNHCSGLQLVFDLLSRFPQGTETLFWETVTVVIIVEKKRVMLMKTD